MTTGVVLAMVAPNNSIILWVMFYPTRGDSRSSRDENECLQAKESLKRQLDGCLVCHAAISARDAFCVVPADFASAYPHGVKDRNQS